MRLGSSVDEQKLNRHVFAKEKGGKNSYFQYVYSKMYKVIELIVCIHTLHLVEHFFCCICGA